MTNDENVKNINQENKDQNSQDTASTEAVAPEENKDQKGAVETPNLNPTDSKGVLDLTNYLEKLADNSVVPNQLNCYKTILVNQGKPTMWGMRLHFPGTFKAGELETSAMNDAGQIDLKKFMQNCIGAGVIVAPRITDLEKFSNTHESFGEAVTKVLNFLNDGSNGKLR